MEKLIQEFKNNGDNFKIIFRFLDGTSKEFSSYDCYDLKISEDTISYSYEDETYFINVQNIKYSTVFKID